MVRLDWRARHSNPAGGSIFPPNGHDHRQVGYVTEVNLISRQRIRPQSNGPGTDVRPARARLERG